MSGSHGHEAVKAEGCHEERNKATGGEDEERTTFMDIPPELRLDIYAYALTPENVKEALDDGREPGILGTCKLIRKEALEFYYASLQQVASDLDTEPHMGSKKKHRLTTSQRIFNMRMGNKKREQVREAIALANGEVYVNKTELRIKEMRRNQKILERAKTVRSRVYTEMDRNCVLKG